MFVIIDKNTNKQVLTAKFYTKKFAESILKALLPRGRKLVIEEVK